MRFIPAPSGLTPFDREASEFLAHLSSAEPIEVEVLHSRDMIAHRRIFAQINDLAKALACRPETLRAMLLWRTGNFELLGEMFGKSFVAVNSMSRRHMTDHELHTFWNEAQDVINKELLPRIEDAAAREHLAATLIA